MKCAGERQEFELAANYRDEIKGLREWIETQD
jgi:protein-arginine kinase activator protein McsA